MLRKTTLISALRAVQRGVTLRGVSLDAFTYGLVALAASLWVVSEFFTSMRAQLFLAQARSGSVTPEAVWSAPLDDVFIHFDFARSAARGLPLQWSDGNGYSSGGTSLLYPFILAAGYLLGYQGGQLMLWAGIIACTSIWITLWCARHLAAELPSWCALFLPPALVCIGALSWTLASGMEVALFLAAWSLCLAAWTRCRATLQAGKSNAWGATASLGLANMILVASRPEAAVLVAIFSITAISYGFRSKIPPLRLAVLLCVTAVPGALVIVGQTAANYWFTGESAAAGALVKLEVNHPYMSSEEVHNAWWFHLKYQILRVTDYHFSDFKLDVFGLPLSSGWLIWALSCLPLLSQKTRSYSLLLWGSVISWMCITAFNGQVRWQNERYTMPAVAWLLLNAGLGLGLVLSLLPEGVRELPHARRGKLKLLAVGLGLVSASLIIQHQAGRFRGQLWFFGRASRNIYEQHIAVAKKLRLNKKPPQRVLVGDAGAIPYVSDVPALDFIGLGGYHQLPFARATRQGIGAGLELIQRMPKKDRPDLMAIYPNWWGDLPTWFGRRLFSVSVRGNVICGGRDKVVYESNWSALNRAFALTPAGLKRVGAELDVADLVSERQSHWRLLGAPGYVTMKMLPHPTHPNRDLWDAGRLMPAGSKATFEWTVRPDSDPVTELAILLAPARAAQLQLRGPGAEPVSVELLPTEGWQVVSLPAPKGVPLELVVVDGELIVYHLWGLTNK